MLAADSGKEAKEPIDEEEPSGPEKRSPGAPIHWEPTKTKLWFLTTVELNRIVSSIPIFDIATVTDNFLRCFTFRVCIQQGQKVPVLQASASQKANVWFSIKVGFDLLDPKIAGQMDGLFVGTQTHKWRVPEWLLDQSTIAVTIEMKRPEADSKQFCAGCDSLEKNLMNRDAAHARERSSILQAFTEERSKLVLEGKAELRRMSKQFQNLVKAKEDQAKEKDQASKDVRIEIRQATENLVKAKEDQAQEKDRALKAAQIENQQLMANLLATERKLHDLQVAVIAKGHLDAPAFEDPDSDGSLHTQEDLRIESFPGPFMYTTRAGSVAVPGFTDWEAPVMVVLATFMSQKAFTKRVNINMITIDALARCYTRQGAPVKLEDVLSEVQRSAYIDAKAVQGDKTFFRCTVLHSLRTSKFCTRSTTPEQEELWTYTHTQPH